MRRTWGRIAAQRLQERPQGEPACRGRGEHDAPPTCGWRRRSPADVGSTAPVPFQQRRAARTFGGASCSPRPRHAARPAAALGAAERRSRPQVRRIVHRIFAPPPNPQPRKPNRAASFIVEIRYKRRPFAKLLGSRTSNCPPRTQTARLKALGGGPAWYQPRHLSAYRRVLTATLAGKPSRRQLFLNFKGCTARPAFGGVRLPARGAGHRVLLIDLDSQGTRPSI